MNQSTVSNPSRSKPTIYDVADRAGVAISTVSRVLNDSMEVSDATRKKVRDAVEALQFRPNRTAKSLAQQSSRTLAVAVPTFTTPFHNELLKGVRSRLKKVDIDLLLCDLKWAAPESTLINFLDRGAMDGLLVAGLPVDERIGAELRKLGAPVVLIGSQWDPLDSFYWDETAGVRLAVEHLIDQGHERIGMITTHVEGAVSRARVRGYQETLAGAGLAVRDAWVATGSTEKHAGFSEEAGHEAMQDLLRADPGVTAVLASSDVQAIGAWQAIRQAGLEVPDDVALVGYDDVKVSRFIGLSSVAQNMHDIGEEATDLLLRRLNGNEQPDSFSRQVVPELIVRTSS
jgi:LacI family transcriptional regulator